MTTQILLVEPFDLIVFGGTGDLSYRKLYPALFRRHSEGQLSPGTRVIAVSRQRMSRQEFAAAVGNALRRFDPVHASNPELLESFARLLDYVTVDAGGDLGWADLKEHLGDDPARVRAFYLATSPELFGQIADRLSEHGLITPAARVIVEKPIGKDGASAAQINDAVGSVFAESQI